MFFHVGHDPLENFPCQWKLGKFYVNTDAGWQQSILADSTVLYKGYADAAPLETLIPTILDQSVPKHTGNFCVLVLADDTLKIQTDLYRSYPIYLGHGINNLVPWSRTAWSDSTITLNSDLGVIENKFDVIGAVNDLEIPYAHALDQVDRILCKKIKQFLDHNTKPLKVFLSGGVDTMLVYSYLVRLGADFELLQCNHLDHDYFWRMNSHLVEKYWAYKQIHHWRDHCVLASGAPGDEFMLRSPTTADLYLRSKNSSIPDLLLARPNSLHHAYFSQTKHQQIFQQYDVMPKNHRPSLIRDLCNIVVNDWQHWHLGNTLTWTPLRDLEIFKILLRLPFEHAVDQIMDSRFSLDLIERNYPGASGFISDQKNTGAVLKNLNRLFC